MKKVIKDHICSGTTKEIFALVIVKVNPENEYEYVGEIIENRFPESLINSVKEYHDAVNDMAFSVLDEIEDRIYFHDLQLQDNKFKLFDISINDNSIRFFIKYPSANGYLDTRPIRRN